VSTTGWKLYAPGDAWIKQLVSRSWTVKTLTEPVGDWQGALFVHSKKQPWQVERRLLTVSGHDAIPMLACYVETSDFGYALGLLRGEPLARYVVHPWAAENFKDGVWALEQCVALHGPDWQRAGLQALAGWSAVAPRPLTAGQLERLLAGEHALPELPLFNALGAALGLQAPQPSPRHDEAR